MRKKAKKNDEGKLLYHLFPVEVQEQVVYRFTVAEKFYPSIDGIPNWMYLDRDRILDAALRHIAEYRKGNLIDEDPKFENSPHLVAAINNLIMLQDIENGAKKDIKGGNKSGLSRVIKRRNSRKKKRDL